MHASVFRARISEEAFQTLLDLMQSNFASLNIPEDNLINREDNQRRNNKAVVISKKLSSSHVSIRKSAVSSQDNLNIRVSHIIKNQSGQEFRGVIEIVFPLFRNPAVVVMNRREKTLEDSHEPMEIEEISYTEEADELLEPFVLKTKIKTEPQDKDAEASEVTRPKNIIRESILKILEVKKLPETNTNENNKKTAIALESSELVETGTQIAEDPDIEKPKSKLRPLVEQDPTLSTGNNRSYFHDFWRMLFFILFPIAVVVACATIAREEFDSEICAHRFDATGAIRDLKNRVFGQHRGIEELGKNLGLNSSGLKILAIIGGTGVGKSYAVHIIGENFSAKKNVFQYVTPLKQKRRFASGAISVCGCNLIIIENLNNRDILEAVYFADYIAGKIDDVNYCVLIINVINVQETDNDLKHEVNLSKSQTQIEHIYREKNFDVKVVRFEPLDDETVTKCIIDAAKSRNFTLSKSQIDDVRISLKISDSGCKGARAKVQLLDRKLELD